MAEPVDSLKTFGRNLSEGLKLARFGGGGEVTQFVCGFRVCEPRLAEVFLAGLPRRFKVRVVADPSDQWLERSIHFSVANSNPSAGSELVRAKLAELLFVETLRRYINQLPVDATGWLAGVRDSIIGHALALLHNNPSHPWTIAEVAREVGLSRSRLAERFRPYLDQPPMAYLAQWRLRLGAEILQTDDNSVAQVAAAVGYGSEAAFQTRVRLPTGGIPKSTRRTQLSSWLKLILEIRTSYHWP